MAKLKPIIPANVDPIKLADEIKRGMTKRVMRDLDKLEKSKSRLAKQS